ncbi:MAG: cytochrome c, partial [Chthoniobacteraceae bacterium]
DIEEADYLCKTAKKDRRQPNGAVHALSAIDDGLKLCTDHADLRELRKELASAFEERTSPQVTPAFLSMAKVGTPTPALEEGRKLYTNRCTECHDLEMLDGRSLTTWERMVSSMGRRANLSEAEKARIMDYIAAAQKVVEAGGTR